MKKEGEETGMCHGGEAEPPAGEEEPKTPAFPQLAYYAKATVSYSFGLGYPSAGQDVYKRQIAGFGQNNNIYGFVTGP